LPESAACLLVGKDLLQLNHLPRQRLDVVLSRIDHGEPLLKPRQVFVRGFRLLRDGLPEPRRHSVQPLGNRFGQLGLPIAEDFRDRAHAALEFGLSSRQFRQACLRLPRPGGCFRLVGQSDSAAAPNGRRKQDDKQNHEATRREQQLAEGDDCCSKPKDWERKQRTHIIHENSLIDSVSLDKIKT